MKIVCKSGTAYDLKMRWPEYKGLLREMRRRASKDQKSATVLQNDLASDEEKDIAAEACMKLAEDLEDMAEAAVRQGLGGVDLADMEEPQDVQDMIDFLVGKASGAEAAPFADSEDTTPTG